MIKPVIEKNKKIYLFGFSKLKLLYVKYSNYLNSDISA